MLDSKRGNKNVFKKGKKTVLKTQPAKRVIDGEETVADDSVATIVVCSYRLLYTCFIIYC